MHLVTGKHRTKHVMPPHKRQVARQDQSHFHARFFRGKRIRLCPGCDAFLGQRVAMGLERPLDTFGSEPAVLGQGCALNFFIQVGFFTKPLPQLNKGGKEFVGIVHLLDKGICHGHHDYRRVHQLRCM